MKFLQRDVDDLDERFRSFKGRVDKRAGRASADGAAPDGEAPAPAPGLNGAVDPRQMTLSVNGLRAAGKWPFGR